MSEAKKSPAGYDEALFRKLLKKRQRNGMVSLSDIHAVFNVVAWDVIEAIKQRKPEELDAADDYILEVIVPGLAKTLEGEGWKIEEYA